MYKREEVIMKAEALSVVEASAKHPNMFFVPRGKSVVKSVRISEDMAEWVENYCKQHGITFNELIRTLLLQLYLGNIPLKIERSDEEKEKKVEIKMAEAKMIVVKEDKSVAAPLKAERLMTESEANYRRYVRVLNQMRRRPNMHHYVALSQIADKASEIMREIEKTMGYIFTPDLLDRLREHYRLQLRIYREIVSQSYAKNLR